jgi:butyryl-CoA dehydrogenase
MDFELTDEQRMIHETARAFTDNEIVDRARENDRNERFDLELVQKIAAQGYLGAIVPREYGGAGLDYLTYGVIVEEVGRGDSAMRTVISVQTSLVCSAILRWGPRSRSSGTCRSCARGNGWGASG